MNSLHGLVGQWRQRAESAENTALNFREYGELERCSALSRSNTLNSCAKELAKLLEEEERIDP